MTSSVGKGEVPRYLHVPLMFHVEHMLEQCVRYRDHNQQDRDVTVYDYLSKGCEEIYLFENAPFSKLPPCCL